MTVIQKYSTVTVEVEATTEEPAAGFMQSGRRVGKGERVRVPFCDAVTLEKQGKVRIVPGTEKVEMR